MAHRDDTMNCRCAVIGIAAIALLTITGVNMVAVRADREAGERHAIARRNAERETEAAVRILHHQWQTTESQVRLLHELATDLQIAFQRAVSSQAGEVLGDSVAPFKVRELQRAKLIASPDLFTQVTLVDNDGAAIWSTLSRGRIRVDLSDREHIRAVLNDGQDRFVGRPVLGRVSGAYTVQLVSANYDHTGHRIGASVVSLDVVAIRNFLRGMRLGDNDEIVIIRQDGVVIASSRFGSIGKALSPSTIAALAIGSSNADTEIIGGSLLPKELGREHPALVMGMPTSGKGLQVAVLRDERDMMAEVEETNIVRSRNALYLQIGIVAKGIALVLAALTTAYVYKLWRARSFAEERLRADQHLALAARMGPGVLYRIDFTVSGAPYFEWVAEAVERVVGYPATEFVGTGMLERIVDEVTHAALLEAARSVREGGSHTMEFRLRRKDGAWLWVHNTLQPCGLMADGTTMVLGYLVDISAAKEQAYMVGQAAKMVTLGEMASGLVHELKLPVATIAMAVDNLQHDVAALPDTEAVRLGRSVDRIAKQAARASRLMKQLSIFGRHEEVDETGASPIEAVSGALILVDYRLRRSGIRLEINLPDNLPMVAGGLLLLEQVLVNLLLNSIDAYEGLTAEAPVIHISARVDGACVAMSVSDKAAGIPPDVLDRIFDPFFTTKPHGRGTGLGLSFSRRVVMNMGGTIRVNSGPTGTEFTVNLPIKQDTVQAPDQVLR